jgi:molybdopterin-guanine dinucleotide biosynthesis protein A
MVGVTAGLERATHPWLAVLAIDLPRMTSEWFRDLRVQTTPGVGAVGRRGEFFEPLAAIYPREFRWLAWEALVKREFSMQRLVAAAVTQGLLKVREIEAGEIPLFANWNSEADRG